MTFGDTKTEKGMRTILLPKGTLHVLKERKKHAVTEWIFPSLLTPEQPTAPNSAYQRLKVILQNAGLPDIRFHDLRHPYVKLKTKKFEDFYYESRRTDFTLPPALALWLVRCQKVIANVIYLNTIVLEDIYTAYQAVRK